MKSDQLKLVSFIAVTKHMGQLTEIAASRGLNMSSLLRLMIAEYVKRHASEAAAALGRK